jgi:hypothetical protein
VKRAFQTDCVGSVTACNIQIAYEKKLNNDFFGPHASLVTMTSVGGELVALSGDFMNPYPDAKLGVIEEGAYADILIVDGNPLEDFSVVGIGDKWFGAEPRPNSPVNDENRNNRDTSPVGGRRALSRLARVGMRSAEHPMLACPRMRRVTFHSCSLTTWCVHSRIMPTFAGRSC